MFVYQYNSNISDKEMYQYWPVNSNSKYIFSLFLLTHSGFVIAVSKNRLAHYYCFSYLFHLIVV